MAKLIIIVDHRWVSPKKIQYWARTLATQTIYSNRKVDWHWFIFGPFTKLPIGICAIYFDLKVVFLCCTLFLKIVFFVGAQSCFSGICRWTQQNHRSDEEFAKNVNCIQLFDALVKILVMHHVVWGDLTHFTKKSHIKSYQWILGYPVKPLLKFCVAFTGSTVVQPQLTTWVVAFHPPASQPKTHPHLLNVERLDQKKNQNLLGRAFQKSVGYVFFPSCVFFPSIFGMKLLDDMTVSHPIKNVRSFFGCEKSHHHATARCGISKVALCWFSISRLKSLRSRCVFFKMW